MLLPKSLFNLPGGGVRWDFASDTINVQITYAVDTTEAEMIECADDMQWRGRQIAAAIRAKTTVPVIVEQDHDAAE